MNDHWKKIEEFQFEKSPQEYGFQVRLAYENGWTEWMTKQAILEYKKFMYLVSISSEMLSPSYIVDIVWHQHLIYSESYSKLCKILGKEVKHIPSTHDFEEQSSFVEAFANTEKIYKEHFDESGWQFWEIKKDSDLMRFTTRKNSIIRIETILIIGTLLFSLLLFFPLRPLLLKIDNPFFVIFYILIFLLVFFGCRDGLQVYLQSVFKEKGGLLIKNLSVNEKIILKTKSTKGIMDLTLFKLVEEQQLKIIDKKFTIIHKRISKDVLEKAVRNSFLKTEFIDYYDLVKKVSVKNCFLQFSKSTSKIAKHIENSEEFRKLENFVSVLFSILLSIGICRFILGITRDRPVFILEFVLVLSIIFIIYYFKAVMPKVISNSLVQLMRDQYKPQNYTTGIDINIAYLMLGSLAFDTEFVDYITNSELEKEAARSLSSSSSGDGSSSSDSSCGSSSGSSCGSSCGGCGGGGD